jgi:hypothetical protein
MLKKKEKNLKKVLQKFADNKKLFIFALPFGNRSKQR